MDYTEQVHTFLGKQLLMHLATCSENTPSVCAVEFVSDIEFNLYWRSASNTQHSKNLLANPQCAVAITALLTNNKGEGIQASGTAMLIRDADTIQSLKTKIDTKRNKNVSKGITEKEDTRDYWKFTPTTLYYINEPELGYDRVEIELTK